MKNLKPCPFCGSKDIDIIRTYINPVSSDSPPDEVYIGCRGCGVNYTEESEKEAIKLWNTRQKLSDLKKEK